MPKVKELGLSSYLKKAEKARQKREKAAAKQAHKAEVLKQKTSRAKSETAYWKEEARRRKARERALKKPKRTGSIFGLGVRKTRQGKKLSRKAPVRAW